MPKPGFRKPPQRSAISRHDHRVSAMNHQEKVLSVYRHMEALGIARSTAASPVWRLLWRVGLDAPSPLFLSFRAAAPIMGGTFGIGWFFLMLLMLRERQDLR